MKHNWPPTNAELALLARVLYAGCPSRSWLLSVARPYVLNANYLLRFIPSGSNLLDVGCGNGFLMLALAAASRIRRGMGIDASAAKIAIANHGLECLRSRFHIKADIEFCHVSGVADWPAFRFDLVTLVDVLHHVPRKVRELIVSAAMERVSIGGTMIVKEMAGSGWRAWANRVHDLIISGELVSSVSENELDGWVGSSGRCLMAQRWIVWWYDHYLRVYGRC